MNHDTSTLITSHRTASYGNYSHVNGEEQKRSDEEREKCRNTSKLLAFATFLIALSIGGYFLADLLANKGKSLKIAAPTQHNTVDLDDNPLFATDNDEQHQPIPMMDLRPNIKGSKHSVAPGHRFDLHYDDEPDDSKEGFSMMKVINCDKSGDVSDDGTTYQEDIRAVANYLKTYWLSYSDSISGQVTQLSNGDPMDPQCIQQQCEEGEVVCKDVSCIYDGQCLWKTTWDSVGICKYYYFDIGNLKKQTRADRRACIASMLVERWTDSCWQHDEISDKMKEATFNWWKQIFTVSDEWTLDDCPCS